MTRDEFVVRWRQRLAEWAPVAALVDRAKVCEEVIADFEAVTQAEDEAELSLLEAAAQSGYSGDHLRRLHRLGKLPAYRRGAVYSSALVTYRGNHQPQLFTLQSRRGRQERF
jgi:DNA-binding SARP family transcriptional activator